MSRFATTLPRASRLPDTTNLAGGEAFSQSTKLELASLLMTSFVTDQYYRSADSQLDRLAQLVGEVEPEFAAKAAIYARTKGNMRSITHALAAELAHVAKGRPWLKGFYDKVVVRPDDATEILAYYFAKYGTEYGKPPNSLKKGLGSALGKFDEYQLAKYRGEGHDLSLVDVVNLCHPRPTEKNAEALRKLVNGTLRSTHTFESKLSSAGQSGTAQEKAAAKSEAWSELLRENKLGYMALLKNLRNIAEQAPELVPLACERLTDAKAVRNSRVLPMRFMTASQQLQSYPAYLQALSQALDLSLANVPDLGKVLVAVDGSGSMGSAVAGNADMSRKGVAAMFAAAYYKKSHADVLVFGDYAGKVTGLNPADSTLTNADRIMRTCYGHSTNFHAIFENAGQVRYDSFVIFSDMQAWVADGWGVSNPQASYASYRRRTKADPSVFAFDLAGYGSAQFPERQVYQLAGFSDSTFDVLGKLKTDREAFVREIEAIEL